MFMMIMPAMGAVYDLEIEGNWRRNKDKERRTDERVSISWTDVDHDRGGDRG